MTQRTAATGILALCCGITAANIYLLQPIAVAAAHHFGVAESSTGLLTSAMQIAYGIGIALFVPIVDLVRARSLLIPLITACAVCLAVMATTSSWATFAVCGCLLGLCCPIPQIIIPAAVSAFGDNSSKLIGLLQSGLLAGILFSRFYSGLIASFLSVSAVFSLSCALTTVSGVLAVWVLPTVRRPWVARISVIPGVALVSGFHRFFSRRPTTLLVCISGLLIGVAFGLFWNSLTFFSTKWYALTSLQIGLFGIVAGISGAMSPIAGQMADRYGVTKIQIVACGLIVAGWIPLLWGDRSIIVAIFATIVIDVGVWSNQVLNQSAIFANTSVPRGLSNALYFMLRFLGISIGSALGSTLFFEHLWWVAVVAAVVATGLGLAIFIAVQRPLHKGPVAS